MTKKILSNRLKRGDNLIFFEIYFQLDYVELNSKNVCKLRFSPLTPVDRHKHYCCLSVDF